MLPLKSRGDWDPTSRKQLADRVCATPQAVTTWLEAVVWEEIVSMRGINKFSRPEPPCSSLQVDENKVESVASRFLRLKAEKCGIFRDLSPAKKTFPERTIQAKDIVEWDGEKGRRVFFDRCSATGA